jgi:hypothetical protein
MESTDEPCFEPEGRSDFEEVATESDSSSSDSSDSSSGSEERQKQADLRSTRVNHEPVELIPALRALCVYDTDEYGNLIRGQASERND